VSPGGEHGGRELRWGELVVARLFARHEGGWRSGGPVISTHGEQARGYGLADLDALLFARSIGDCGELTGKLLVEHCLPRRIERHKGIMTGLSCRGIGSCAAGSGGREEI